MGSADPNGPNFIQAMRLKVLLPAFVLVDRDVVKTVAEAENGYFGVLPRHVDFLAALKAGVLTFETTGGEEGFVGHDLGILVKRGADVLVCTQKAVLGTDLAALRGTIEREFKALDEREQTARTALARLEAGMVRRFMELEEQR